MLPGATSGPERYSTDSEEQQFFKKCAKVGYAKTRKQHPELSTRTAKQVEYPRAVAKDQTVVNHYFGADDGGK